MCVIAIRTIGSTISDERIRQLYASNPDGAGVMWAQDGKVHWRKGFFNVEKLLDMWHRIPNGVTAAVHCRITTHGGTCDRLCHPFPLTNRPHDLFKLRGKADAVLMHNGIMSFMEKDGHYDKNKDSDSSAYAKKLFDMLHGARLPKSTEEMETIRKETSGSRIFILSGDGTFFTAGEWTWEDGVLYSNTHFKWHYNYGTGWQGYNRNYNYNSGVTVNGQKSDGFHYNGYFDDDDDYYWSRYDTNKQKWELVEDEWKKIYGTNVDKEEDVPTPAASKKALTDDEILEYAQELDRYPCEYFGEVKYASTGLTVRGQILETLYTDLAGNIYELDEDTLEFYTRDDLYLDEFEIGGETKQPLLSDEEVEEYTSALAMGADY